MKRLSLAFLTILAISISSCEKDVVPNCIEVRVVAEVCGNAVLQVVGNDTGLSLETWTDHDGVVYENTFGTFLDPCQQNYPEDTSQPFFVTIADSRENTNCIVCLALLANMPDQNYNVKVVVGCRTSQID
ncbi:hypothetical protein [Roseivirga sp. E12]|uniref:hypothetical protein n=1 Tax=Roseivirga sp. E12 TaxID=2819237 RepID=UPI001ABD1EE7|nr:hypothetical protein [Roseivirga sp. E12]MBO3697473.1 hypothetical protein [Roseivirga sp. E12]